MKVSLDKEPKLYKNYINGSVQDCGISFASILEILIYYLPFLALNDQIDICTNGPPYKFVVLLCSKYHAI